MPNFHATALVAADPQQVWDTLLDVARWPSWDPQLTGVTGRLGPGERLEIRTRAPSRPFRLRVTAWEPPSRLVLTGGMPLGLFVGTRTYDVVAVDSGTQVTMRETYSGPLTGLIGRSIPDLQPGFESFVEGLRAASVRQDARHTQVQEER